MSRCYRTYLTKQQTNTFQERLGHTRICGMGNPDGVDVVMGLGLNDDSRKFHEPKQKFLIPFALHKTLLVKQLAKYSALA